MAIAEIEDEKKRKTQSLIGLTSLAVILAVTSGAAWWLFDSLERMRLQSQQQTIGRALSDSDPELFAKEMKEHRDEQARWAAEQAAQTAQNSR